MAPPPPAPSTAPPAPPPPGRGLRRVALVAGLIALLGVGWFAWRGFSGQSGGAASPQGAVRALATAINGEDPIGALAVLAPDEVRTLADLLGAVEARAQGVSLAPEQDAYGGIDIEVEGLELSEEKLSNDAVRVNIDSGTAKWKVDRQELGTRLQEIGMDPSYSGRVERDDLVLEDWVDDDGRDREVEIEPFVIVVKRGSGWYISPFHTAMAWLVEYHDLPEGDYDRDPADGPGGADSPEEAVLALVETLDDLDPERTFRYLPTREFAVLGVYRRAIEDLIDEAVGGSAGFTLDVADEDLEIEDLPGGRRKVIIEGASGQFETIDDDGYRESFSWEIDGLCLDWTGPDGERDGGCLDDDEEFADLFDALEISAPFVVTERDRGGWVVSPVATVLQYGIELLPRLSDAWALRLLGLEFLAPTDVAATVGSPIEGTFNEAGYAVVDVTLAEGDRITVVGDEDLVWSLDGYDPDLDSIWGALRGRPVEEAGRYRFVAWGDAGDDFALTLARIEVQELGDELVATGTLTADAPIALHRFQVGEAGSYLLDSALGGTDGSIEDENGYEECSSDYTCELAPDVTYVLRVVKEAEDDVDYEIRVLQGSALQIDGRASTSGYVSDDDHTYHWVRVPRGTTAFVGLTWSGTADLDLHCADESVCAGSTGTGPYEEITITGPYEGEIIVSSYRGAADYTLTISD